MEYKQSKSNFDPDRPWESIRESISLQLGFFLVIWLLCSFAGAFISQGIAAAFGIHDFKALMEGFKEGESLYHINSLKVMNIFSHLLMYLIPVVVFTYFIYRSSPAQSLYLDKAPRFTNVLLSIALILVIYPFISFVYYWNTYLLPDSAISKDTLFIQGLFLDMKEPKDFILNLILLGLVAGIGEELLFRGFLQRIVTKWTRNKHFGAIITGFFFSFIHFQLEGFFPRFILGVLFCYLLLCTGNLWITVVIHILFNSTQVVIPYFYPDLIAQTNSVSEVSPVIAMASLLGFAGIFFIFIKNNPDNKYIEFD